MDLQFDLGPDQEGSSSVSEGQTTTLLFVHLWLTLLVCCRGAACACCLQQRCCVCLLLASEEQHVLAVCCTHPVCCKALAPVFACDRDEYVHVNVRVQPLHRTRTDTYICTCMRRDTYTCACLRRQTRTYAHICTYACDPKLACHTCRSVTSPMGAKS